MSVKKKPYVLIANYILGLATSCTVQPMACAHKAPCFPYYLTASKPHQTLCSLQCFQWILDGSDSSYEEMTKNQPSSLCLQKKSFSLLHQLAISLLHSHPQFSKQQMQSLFVKALLLKSLESDENFYSLQERRSLLFSLSAEEAQFLQASYNLDNFEQMLYLEGGATIFCPIKQRLLANKDALLSLDFALLFSFCSLSAEKSSLRSSSFLSLTQKDYLAFETVWESCHLLSLPKKRAEDAYLFCIEKRAQLLHWEVKKSNDHAMVRLSALLRIFSPQEGSLLKETFRSLSFADRESILLPFKEKTGASLLSKNLSSLLIGLFDDPLSGESPKEKLNNIVTQVLPFIAHIIKDATEQTELGLLDPHVYLDFQSASLCAKEHLLDPSELSYQIDKQGNVLLFSPPEPQK